MSSFDAAACAAATASDATLLGAEAAKMALHVLSTLLKQEDAPLSGDAALARASALCGVASDVIASLRDEWTPPAPAPPPVPSGAGSGAGAGADESTSAPAPAPAPARRVPPLNRVNTMRAKGLGLGEKFMATPPSKGAWLSTQKDIPKGPIATLFENNRKWVKAKIAGDPDYFRRLRDHQYPDYLFIGCADSRVPANNIMGLKIGELFVHRNVANLVTNSDMNAQAVIEYAVSHLRVKDIIICGHYGCGGVAAAMANRDFGTLEHWLTNIRDVFRLHRDELKAITDHKARHRRLVELNVGEQCVNLLKLHSVQSHRRDRGLRVHGMVYDIEDGILHKVKIDFASYNRRYGDIFRVVETVEDAADDLGQ